MLDKLLGINNGELDEIFKPYIEKIYKETANIPIGEVLDDHYIGFKKVLNDPENNLIDCLVTIDRLLGMLNSNPDSLDELKNKSKEEYEQTIQVFKSLLEDCINEIEDSKKRADEAMQKLQDPDAMSLQDMIEVYAVIMQETIPYFLLKESFLILATQKVFRKHQSEIHESFDELMKKQNKKKPDNKSNVVDLFGKL